MVHIVNIGLLAMVAWYMIASVYYEHKGWQERAVHSLLWAMLAGILYLM